VLTDSMSRLLCRSTPLQISSAMLTSLLFVFSSTTLRKHVHFETEYCFACGMQGLDLRCPTSYIISLHGARQCNEHSLGQVHPPAAPKVHAPRLAGMHARQQYGRCAFIISCNTGCSC
jgi:hypothetical protein